MSLSIHDLPRTALALPGVSVAVLALSTVVMAIFGFPPLWRDQNLNMSEAAALRDSATVLKLIRAGQDPDERRLVRAGIVSDRSLALTPLEAAIATRRPEVVEILLWAGSRPDGPAWIRARCLAGLASDKQVEEVVDRYKPPQLGSAGDRNCAGVERPW